MLRAAPTWALVRYGTCVTAPRSTPSQAALSSPPGEPIEVPSNTNARPGRRREPARRGGSAAPSLAVLSLALTVGAAGCPCVAPIVNSSPELRWWLFSNFGAQRICPELTKRGLSLRLQERSPAIGRFFPSQCSFDVDNARQVVVVHFNGSGYGYLNPAKRVGFTAGGSIEYRPDFMIAGEDMYVWGKMNRIVRGPDFQLGYVENKVIDVAAGLPGIGPLATFFGNQVVAGELSRGFTVVHNEDRGNDFAMGFLAPPAKPYRPFDVTQTNRFTYANESIEVHSNQRDYLGPFDIPNGKSFYLTLTNQGPAVDLMIVDKMTGDYWRDGYQKGLMQPPTGPVVAGQPIQPGMPVSLKYKLNGGVYYVVIDNSASAGLVSPPMSLNPFGDAMAVVSYVAQVGD